MEQSKKTKRETQVHGVRRDFDQKTGFFFFPSTKQKSMTHMERRKKMRERKEGKQQGRKIFFPVNSITQEI